VVTEVVLVDVGPLVVERRSEQLARGEIDEMPEPEPEPGFK